MEYLTLTETGIYHEMDHVLEQGMLNCFSGTASKQGTFKAVRDLTSVSAGTAYFTTTTTTLLAIATFDSDKKATRSMSLF